MSHCTDLFGNFDHLSAKITFRMIYCSLLAIVIFVVDLFLPLGVAGGVLYVAVVLCTLWLPQRGAIIIAASVSTILILLGLALSPSGGELWKVLTNRFLAIFAVWVIAVLLFQRKHSELVLQTERDILERVVQERTSSLADAIVHLQQELKNGQQAEAKIRESEQRFQAFMNHSPTVAFLKNEKGQYIYVNQLFEEKLNMVRENCLGKTDDQLFPPEVARIFREHDQEALKKREVLETEETTLDSKGEVRFWWVMKFPVRNMEGQLLLGGVALDITVRKNVEEALRKRERELQETKENLQALGGKLISAQEDERRRLSRELHDDMNQRLALLALNIQSAQKGLIESSPIYQTLSKLYDGVSTLSDDVRHLAYQLHPSILDDLGLKVAIQSFVDDFSKWEGISVAFISADISVSLHLDVDSCLYRVVQECLRNVSRHAQATKVDIKLLKEKGGLKLSIQDNGKGFVVDERRLGKHGLGLIGMQERVRVVHGTYEVQSAPGQGTKITVWVPLEEVKREK